MLSDNDREFLKRFNEEFMAKMAASMGAITPEGYRAAMESLPPWKNSTPVPEPKLAAYHAQVELCSGLNAAIAVPEGRGPFPIFIITHGNGLAAGSSQLYRRLTKDIAARGYVAITPDFRLAPEHPFPAGYDDMKFTAYWARDNAAKYGGDGSHIVLWGDSLGATLALGLVLGLGDEPNAPEIKAFVGAEGFYDFSTPMMSANPIIQWYIGDGGEELLKDKRVSPLLHISDAKNLPGIFLIAGSGDFALGPTLDLARKLQESGKQFQLHVIEGMPHDFMKFPQLDGMNEGHRLMCDFLERCVGA